MQTIVTGNRLLLFVYGTLRRGCTSGAHEKYLGNATLVGHGRVQARLYQVSFYPALVPCEEDRWVTGEVYQLPNAPALARIDDYECCSPAYPPPHEYQRVALPVTLDSGEIITAWCYIYQFPQHALQPLPFGDFLNRLSN